MGYLYAFGAFLCIGSYLVPARRARSTGLSFIPLLGAGLLVGALFLLPYLVEILRSPRWAVAVTASGVLWCLGQCAAGLSLEQISLAKGSALYNVNTLINLAAGLIWFGEGARPGSAPWIVSGGLLLFIGAVWVAWAQASPEKEGDLTRGVVWGLVAAVCWGVYFLPLVSMRRMDPGAPFGTLHILAGLMATGGSAALLSGFLLRSKPGWKLDLPWGFASAILWTVGTGFFLAAINRLGLAKTVPVVNCNVLMYAFWSLFVFKELPLAQAPRVLGGCVAIALGIALISQG
jgi:drug/metabolite transporter (DMT)-like permease